MKPIIKIYRENLILILIFTAGAILRLWQIDWGLPELYEEATPLRISWGFWNWNKPGLDFNPHFFNYPALTFYIQFIAQAVNFGFGYLFGIYPDLNAFGLTLTPLAVTARLIGVLFDLGTLTVVYLIGKEIADRRIALISAAVVSVNPSHIIHAHLVEVEPVLTFFVTLSLLFMLRIFHRPAMKWYLLSGVFIALAAASKYTGAFLIIVLIFTHLLRYSSLDSAIQSIKERSLIYSIMVSFVGFFLLNPYILLNYEKFKNDFSFEQYHMSYGHLGLDSSGSTIGYYFGEVLPEGFGWAFFLILIGTVIYFLIRRNRRDILLLLFPAIYVLIVSTWEMRAERYLLPILPVLGLICATGLVRLYDRLSVITPSAAQRFVLPIIVLILLVQPAMTSKKYLRSADLPDTRSITKKWIENNIEKGSAIATGPYGVDFADSSYLMFPIPLLVVESELVAPFYDSRWYEDFDLLITSSHDYARFIREPEKYASFLPYYDSLRVRWKLVFSIEPSEYQNGPAFWLYKYPDSLQRRYFDAEIFERFFHNPESIRISNFLKGLNYVEFKKGKYEKSEQILKEILSVEIDNYPIRNELAQILYNLGKYDAALKQLEISVRADPDQPKVLALAGSALIRINQLKAAEGPLLRATMLNPRLEPPYLELIDLYKSQRDNLKLLDILKRYYAILPRGTEKEKEIKAMIEKVQNIKN